MAELLVQLFTPLASLFARCFTDDAFTRQARTNLHVSRIDTHLFDVASADVATDD